MRALIVLALFVATLSAAAQTGKPPWMTGERLLQLVAYPPTAKGNFDLTPKQHLDAERARAYVEGVHDSSDGQRWCNSKQVPAGPDALREAVEMNLRKLPPDQLKRNAADLVIETWASRWPCTDRRDAR
ncbi:hypothetical protein NX774_14780 [Massilia agilis]|uniref:Rap1a immunity protein domain-containing protein n=1 Tax=Massilia agilis TaxID=1811226 RepID=A0ABT2DDG2_9BURK|nr:Rap1a/Tai family immunity protein [Massilia agilis]MCS0809192.1 hypothetical protein [Massilia agilis]